MSALSKMGYAVLWEDGQGNTRWVWFEDENAALHYATSLAELGRALPLVIKAQEVKP